MGALDLDWLRADWLHYVRCHEEDYHDAGELTDAPPSFEEWLSWQPASYLAEHTLED